MGIELLLFLPVVYWFYLKFRQNKMINNVVKEMEELGQVYFGQDAERKMKMILFAATDKRGTITGAKMVRLVRTLAPAKVFDVPEIVGKKMEDLHPSKITRDADLREALKSLKRSYLVQEDEQAANDKDKKIRKRVKTKRVVQRKR